MNYKEEIKHIMKTIILINWNRVLGIILLLPPLYSVFSFLFKDKIFLIKFLSSGWTGIGTGYTSALPLYFGLMAIAGAILLSCGNKK